MTKRINFATINPDMLNALSTYHKSLFALAGLAAVKADALKAIPENIPEVEKEAKAEVIIQAYKDARKPVIQAQRKALQAMAYERVYDDGSKRGKSVNGIYRAYLKAAEGLLENREDALKPLAVEVQAFLLKLEVANANEPKAVQKFARNFAAAMGLRATSGKALLESGDYVRELSEKTFTTLFFRYLFSQTVGKAFEETAEHGLKLKAYPAESPEATEPAKNAESKAA